MQKRTENTCGNCGYFNTSLWICGEKNYSFFIKPHNKPCSNWTEIQQNCKQCKFWKKNSFSKITGECTRLRDSDITTEYYHCKHWADKAGKQCLKN